MKFKLKAPAQQLKSSLEICMSEQHNYCELRLIIKPGAQENNLKINTENKLILSIQNPPIEGKANAAIIKLLSQVIKIQRKDVQLMNGETSKFKKFRLQNTSISDVYTRLLEY